MILFRALHLSDFHFGPMAHWHDENNPAMAGVWLAQEVIQALNKNQLPDVSPLDFDAVILSGDFAWRGKPAAGGTAYPSISCFRSAHAFVMELVREGLVNRELANLVVMPGNHDISRSDRMGDPERTRTEAEQEFREFLRLLFPNDPHRLTSHLGYCHVFSSREGPPVRPVVLLSLNSCRIETAFTPGLGWVGYDQIYSLIRSDLPERLKQWERLAPERTLELPVCIACLHHHVHLTDPIPPSDMSAREEGKVSILTDAPEMLDALMELGFGIILHGHAHSPRRYAYGQHFRRERHLSLAAIAGAGSVCLAKESKNIHHSHQFQVVECLENDVVIRSYEVPLRGRNEPRQWTAIEFEFPYTRDHDGLFVEAMQGRLSLDLETKAEYELGRFNACVDFEDLLRGNLRLQDEVLTNLVKVLARPPSGEPAIRARFEQRLNECRADRARAKEERIRLHRWLKDRTCGRLDTYLALTWEWPPIDEPTR